jgi:hypothetical protein
MLSASRVVGAKPILARRRHVGQRFRLFRRYVDEARY